ncbi:MAG: hypothetical protein ACLT9P_09170 [Evtepia gabavorous]
MADTDTAAPGGLLTYTLTIANLGPATAQDVLSHRPDSRRSVPRGSFPGQRAHLDPVDRGLFPEERFQPVREEPCCCAAACLPLPRAPL